MTETVLQSHILRTLGSHPDVRIFRNTVGEAWQGKTVSQTPGQITLAYPRHITFGLATGSGDLIGFRSYEIRPEDVGRRIAVFTSVEIKQARGVVAQNQRDWLHAVTERGGIAIVARSEDEALHGVLDWTASRT